MIESAAKASLIEASQSSLLSRFSLISSVVANANSVPLIINIEDKKIEEIIFIDFLILHPPS